MTERRAEKARPIEVAAEEPDVIVVPYRAARHSAKLLPPTLLLLLGLSFLAYRARSSDWRGISPFFEPRPKPASPPATLPLPPVADEAVAAATEKTVADPVTAEGKIEETEKPKEIVKAGPNRERDPLDDIQREAEATRERIAGLEKLKEQEARKLDETADARGRDDVFNRRNNPLPFQARALAPEEVERRLKEQSEQLRRQMSAMARLQLQQMERMAATQRDFFDERARGQVPGQGRLPWLVPPPPPRPDFARRPPAGAGAVPRFQEFQAPNGMRGFRFDFRPAAPWADDVPPPPPRPLSDD